jgi:hypothetical protein
MSAASARAFVFTWPIAVAAGAALGVAYTLSPLAVLGLAALGWFVWWASRDLSEYERPWFFAMVGLAVVARLAAIAALFLLADPSRPYAAWFGDEELHKSRPLWLRNIGLGLPTSPADIIYAYDDTGQSGYLYWMAYLQALVGSAPYGIHVLNAVSFVASALVFFRLARHVFGRAVAATGVAALLFMPSLFIWSVSALKEPLHLLLSAVELVCLVQLVRAARWRDRGFALLGLVASGLALELIRRGAMLSALVGAGLGLATGLSLERRRWWVPALAGLAIAAGLAATPAVQTRVMALTREAARLHVGHVFTPGYSYRALDPVYYWDPAGLRTMPADAAARFLVRSGVSYLVEPLPWRVESRAALAYLPEQAVWYAMLIALPFGIVAALGRDRLVTCLLLAHAFGSMAVVSITGGNIGTLVRHRSLVFPYVIFLSMLGVAWLLERAATLRPSSPQALRPSSPHALRPSSPQALKPSGAPE